MVFNRFPAHFLTAGWEPPWFVFARRQLCSLETMLFPKDFQGFQETVRFLDFRFFLAQATLLKTLCFSTVSAPFFLGTEVPFFWQLAVDPFET